MLDGVIAIEIAEKRCRILLAGGLRVSPPPNIGGYRGLIMTILAISP